MLVMLIIFEIFQTLEEKERKTSSHRENLQRDQRYLRRRLELLSTQVDAIHKRRSVSECSTSTVSSSQSSHSESGKNNEALMPTFDDLLAILFDYPFVANWRTFTIRSFDMSLHLAINEAQFFLHRNS